MLVVRVQSVRTCTHAISKELFIINTPFYYRAKDRLLQVVFSLCLLHKQCLHTHDILTAFKFWTRISKHKDMTGKHCHYALLEVYTGLKSITDGDRLCVVIDHQYHTRLSCMFISDKGGREISLVLQIYRSSTMATVSDNSHTTNGNGGDSDEGPDMQKMSWRQYKHLIQQKEATKKAQEEKKRKVLQRRIKQQQQIDEQRRKEILAALKVEEAKINSVPVNTVKKPTQSTHRPQKRKGTEPHKQGEKNIQYGPNTKQRKPVTFNAPQTNQNANKKSVKKTNIQASQNQNVPPRFNQRSRKPPFSSDPKIYPPSQNTKQVPIKPGVSRRDRPLVGDKPISLEPESPRNKYSDSPRDEHPLLKREMAKAKKFGHVKSKLYNYSDSERYQNNLRESIDKHGPKQPSPSPINRTKRAPKKASRTPNYDNYYDNDEYYYDDYSSYTPPKSKTPRRSYQVDQSADNSRSRKQTQKSTTPRFQQQKAKGTYQMWEEIPITDTEYQEIEDTAFETRKKPKRKPKPRQTNFNRDGMDYNYNQQWKSPTTTAPDIKKIIQSQPVADEEESVRGPPPRVPNRSKPNRRPRLPEIRTIQKPPSPPPTPIKTPDLSRYHLPDINTTRDSSIETQLSYRHYRELRPSQSKRRRFTDRETWKDDVAPYIRKSGPSLTGSLDTNSISTIRLDDSHTSSRHTDSRIPRPANKKHFDINPRVPRAFQDDDVSTPRGREVYRQKTPVVGSDRSEEQSMMSETDRSLRTTVSRNCIS